MPHTQGVTQPLLAVEGVTLRFGGVVALDGVSFAVEPDQIYGLIGPNGAGKTTLFNCISRIYFPDAGDIRLNGRSLMGVSAHRVAPLGIARTFQNLALFRSLTTLQNVMLGGHCRTSTGWVANSLRLGTVRHEEARLLGHADALLELLGLRDVRDVPVGELPFGIAKRVELGRALAAEPAMLLLDEPAAGLNHEEVEALARVVRTIRDRQRCTILLIEHHMGLVMSVSERVCVLNFGRKIAEGSPAEIQSHPDVMKCYLGEAA